MKTNFESIEDQAWLEQILMRAMMTTENLFTSQMQQPEFDEYREAVILTRAKIFEYLGQADPNIEAINSMQKPKIVLSS